jgi:2-polyprenyl-3-methyl-5-hydroxy-6-metoxy-1,4-benzoquinol methylase
MNIISPITHSENVKLYNEINSLEIINKYELEYGTNVSRFFEGLEKIKIYECIETGYRFYYPNKLMGDAKLYEDLQKVSSLYYSKWKWEYQIAQKFINKNDSVLDVGCGSGYFLESQKHKTQNLFGLEFNDEAIRKCGLNNILVKKQFIEEYSENNLEDHDVATSFQVLEHVQDINSFITANLKTLKKGGKLIIGVPNSNPYLYKSDVMHTLNLPPHHMGLWNKQAFNALPNHFNMKLEGLFVEPIYDLEYWFSLNYGIIKKDFVLPLLIKVVLLKTIARFIEGRNIVAVYSKL